MSEADKKPKFVSDSSSLLEEDQVLRKYDTEENELCAEPDLFGDFEPAEDSHKRVKEFRARR